MWDLRKLDIYFLLVLTFPVEAQTKARWLELCAEAAICDDPDRLAAITKQIVAILQFEKVRLRRTTPQILKLRGL